jgi:SET domain-containing protein
MSIKVTEDQSCSYFSPKLRIGSVDPVKGRFGMFAQADIKKGELLTVVGGSIYTLAELDTLSDTIHSYSIQVDDNAYIAPHREGEPAYLINHSCNPNAGLRGQVSFVAMRDIQAGEEICFDYAMTDATPYDEFTCQCGHANCRGNITGYDWQRPELWERYEGFFSTYVQLQINRYQQEQAVKVNGNGHVVFEPA